MRTEEITEDNLEDFSPHIDPEKAENIGRDSFRALAVLGEDGAFGAGAVWEIKFSENEEKDTTANLAWLSVPTAECSEALFSGYSSMIAEDEVGVSEFELPVTIAEKDLLTSNGFEVSEKEGSDIIVTVGDLANLKLMRINKVIPSYVMPLTDISEREFKRGLMNCIFRSKRELMEDLPSLPIEWYDPDLSCCVGTDGKIEGFLLVHRMVTGRLRVELLVDVGVDAQVELLNMVRFSMKQAVERYAPDTMIVLHRSDSASSKLISFLFPKVQGETVLAGNRKEKS